MKRQVLIGMGGAAGLVAAGILFLSNEAMARSGTDTTVQPQAEVQATVGLSGPAREVVRMAVSGVSDDVIKAYIESSASTFNLTSDQIIHLQGIGISSTLTSSMLGHDKNLRDQAGAPQPANGPQAAPYTNPPPQTADDQQVYDNLSPYGNWDYVDGYGWYWQPYGWLGYDYYPWPWLGFGYWWWWPNRGWCWFPHSHFRDFDRLHSFNHFGGFNRFAGTARPFGFNRFNSGLNRFNSGQFRAQTFSRPFSTSRGTFGFNGFTTSRSGVGGGFHNSGGWHGGGGFHGGGGGGHGGGGSHGGGGGRR